MYKKDMNLPLCLIVDGVWIPDQLCPSPIVKLDSGRIRVEIQNKRGAHVVEDPHADRFRSEQNDLLFVAYLQFCRLLHFIEEYP